MKVPRATPTSDDLAIWSQGARTVSQARREFNLSRQDLFTLMEDGVLRYCVKDLKRTRLIAYGDLVKYVASLYAAQALPAKKGKGRL